MDAKLQHFLEAKDPGTLQSAKSKLGALAKEELDQIRSIVNNWEPSRALWNLLFYPSVLPPDIQKQVVLAGICDHNDQYLVLAATVGLQELHPHDFSAEEREKIVNCLLQNIARYQNVLADRASASVLPFLQPTDDEKVIAVLANKSETVLHNLLGWLYITTAHSNYAELRLRFEQEKIDTVTQNRIEKKLGKDEQAVNSGFPSLLGSPLYSWIPGPNEI